MGRIRRFLLRHGPEDRALLLEALAEVARFRVALSIRPFTRVLEAAERPRKAPRARSARPPGPAEPPIPLDRIDWAVAAASRVVPGARCLARALAGKAMLERRGLRAELRIGVGRAEKGGGVEAHAWLEHGRGRILGSAPPPGYVLLDSFAEVRNVRERA